MATTKKGSAFGYPFLFFSAIFYLWLGFLLTQGADKYLQSTMPQFQNVTYNNNITAGLNSVGVVLTSPFTAIGFLAWLSIAIFIVDVYIVVSSIT